MFSETIKNQKNQDPYKLPSLVKKNTMDTIENLLYTYPESAQHMASHEYLGSEELPWYGLSKYLLYNMNHRKKKSSISMMLKDRNGGLQKILYGHA